MLILIDGFWGSGKTILRSLLDGHEELKVSPSQECIISSFCRNKKNSEFLKYKDLRLLRKYLSDSHYYSLEQENFNGYKDSDLAKNKVNFNFTEFEKFWTQNLMQIQSWTNQSILEIIHNSIIKYFYNLKEYPANHKKVFLEDNSFYAHSFFLEEFDESKLIIIENSTKDILASLVNRKVNLNDYRTNLYEKYNFHNLVRKFYFPLKLNKNFEITKNLKNKYPERIYVCDFKNLIFNTKNEMTKIAKFLKINFNETLITPTHFGKKLEFKDNNKILGKEKYTAQNSFSKYEIKLLSQFEKKFPNYNFLSLSFFDFLTIKFFYFIKTLIKKMKKEHDL